MLPFDPPFDPNNPFPLADGISYSDAQLHAEAVDSWLGLETGRIENELLKRHENVGQELWIGLPTRSLLTPYTEIRELLARLKPAAGATIVDLGAGYGRMGHVIGRHYPEVRFIGYEYVKERVLEARRCLAKFEYPLVEIQETDLASNDFEPTPADYYFLYDYGARSAVEKTLQDLRKIAKARSISVIARGRLSRDVVERQHPWLSGVLVPSHYPHYSIYRSS